MSWYEILGLAIAGAVAVSYVSYRLVLRGIWQALKELSDW